MNRLLRFFFFLLAALLAVMAALVAWDLSALGASVVRSKSFWMLVAATFFFGLAAVRFPVRAKFKISLVLFAFALMETFLQVLGWAGLLPALNTKEYVPWGRVYWRGEGFGNSVRNRYAWHFPEFDLARTNRVAVIGDSFVEAVEVRRARSLGVALRDRIAAADPGRTVLSLGFHGTGPAHYLEVLKYAHRHFAVREAVLMVYLGSDITDSSPRLQFHDPTRFIYYSMGANGVPVLDAQGEQARRAFAQHLESRHGPALMFLPRILLSHCITLQLPLSVKNARAIKKRMAADVAHHPGSETALAQLGLKGAPFVLQPAPEAREAAAIMHGLLGMARDFAATNSIRLRIVTIPFFPPEFYAQQGAGWTTRLGEYDFLGPDRELAAWCAREGVPFLSLAEAMRARRMTPAEIRPLYLSNGCGHFSDAGHRFAADSVHSAFFANRALP